MSETFPSSPPAPANLGNTAETEHVDTMRRAVQLLEAPEEVFEQNIRGFIAERMAHLSEGTSNEGIGLGMGTTRVDEFISPTRPMISSAMMSKPYVLDDPEAYAVTARMVRDVYQGIKAKTQLDANKAYLNAVLQGANTGQAKYFGSYTGDVNKLLSILEDIVDDDAPEQESISSIGASAVCQERAAVAHNTLKIFGLDSSFMTGRLSGENTNTGESVNEPHAYIVLRTGDGATYLFDPANPVLTIDSEGLIRSSSATFKKLEGDVSNGVDHVVSEIRIDANGQKTKSAKYNLHYTFSATPF